MRLFIKSCLFFTVAFHLNLFASKSNIMKIAPEAIVYKDGTVFIQEQFGTLYSYPNLELTRNGIFLKQPLEQQRVIYICKGCSHRYDHRKPIRCRNCGGDEFLVRYQ